MRILTILDGLCDVPAPALSWKTPLQSASCATLAAIREQGAWGLFNTCPLGMEPDSMGCILTLLGVSPTQIPSGRACLEALAQGLRVEENDLWLRASLCAVSKSREETLLSAVGAGLSDEGLLGAAKLLQRIGGKEAEYYPAGAYRGLIRLPGCAGWERELALLPPHQNIGRPVSKLLPAGTGAKLLREFIRESEECLRPLAGTDRRYLLLPWGAAAPKRLPLFSSLHQMSARAVCAAGIVRGIAAAMKLDCPAIPGVTADSDTDLAAKLRAVWEGERADFILLHINGADECAHRRDPKEKAAFLARVGRELLAPLYRSLGPADSLLICGDHDANSQTGRHGRGLQPFWLAKAGCRGNLGVLPGTKTIGLLKGEIQVG